VEIACIITDSELTPLDDGIDIVIRPTPAELAEMDDFVRAMHTKSGLLKEMEASTIDLATAGAQTLAYVQSHVPAPRTAPVCGNSIGVDRRFLDQYLSTLDQYLHYRSIDVSSLKELCRRWYPAIYKKRPGKNEAHRALGDIRESIEELRYYRGALFIASPEVPATAP
jgi:oligoribonuclease